jgi:hypothetical protein
MNEQTITSATEVSFKDFLFKNKRNRTILILAGVAIVVQFAIFKYLYPYASFIHGDSFVYLRTAYDNLDINTYMVGYSRFLRIVSSFSSSDTFLVAFQYMFVQISALYFLFTIFYCFQPSKIVQTLLLCFMVFNPLFLYLANYVSSDVLFLALCFIWFTTFLWIIRRPTSGIVILHILILFITFTVRYNALIFPFISAGVLLFSRLQANKKILSIASCFLLCGLFVMYTANKYKSLTGTWQYAPFSGWQIANNAMYAYRYVDSADRKTVPKRFMALDNMIREYFDTTKSKIYLYPQELDLASTEYMWNPKLTLYKYRDLLFAKDPSAFEFKKWGSMGPYYSDYGLLLIKQYPWHYIRYFLWPNANKYYAPPVEFLENYNMGRDSVTAIARMWFGYKTNKVTTRTKDFKVTVLNFYPILSGIANVVMLLGLICFGMLNGFREKSLFSKGTALAGIIWLLNAGFTILASAAALRFQSFPILMSVTFATLLVGWLVKLALTSNTTLENVNLSNANADTISKTIA